MHGLRKNSSSRKGHHLTVSALLDKHAADDAGHSFRSGTNVEHVERHDLLNEVAAERQAAVEKKVAAIAAWKKKADRDSQKLTAGALGPKHVDTNRAASSHTPSLFKR